MGDAPLITDSVRDYFQQVVDDALAYHDVRPSPEATAYLVDLLCAYATRPAALLDKPLGVLLLETKTARTGKRIQVLKLVGDQALYVAGYFGEHAVRQDLDLDYYMEVGGTAYRSLSSLVGKRPDPSPLADVYGELALEFRNFVEVLAGVRQQAGPQPEDVGSLYEEWLRTGSGPLRRRLEREGVVFPRVPGEDTN